MLALTSPVHLETGQTAQVGAYDLARYMVVCQRYSVHSARPGACLIAHTKQGEQNTAERAEWGGCGQQWGQWEGKSSPAGQTPHGHRALSVLK